MFVSFIISTYEYNHVHQQYEQAWKLAEQSKEVLDATKADLNKIETGFYSMYNEQYLKMKNTVKSFDYKKMNSWSN